MSGHNVDDARVTKETKEKDDDIGYRHPDCGVSVINSRWGS